MEIATCLTIRKLVTAEVSLEATNDVAAVTAGEFEGTVMSPRHQGLSFSVLSCSCVVF
jgi:hypothetical protein